MARLIRGAVAQQCGPRRLVVRGVIVQRAGCVSMRCLTRTNTRYLLELVPGPEVVRHQS